MKIAVVAAVLAIVLATDVRAEQRMTIVPSIEIFNVSDDNLNYSVTDPLTDQIRRITPSLQLRFDSPRWSSRFSGAIDSEQYATHSTLDDNMARQRAAMSILFHASPRATVAIDADYMNTNTLGDLNTDTGLAGSRIRARRFSASPSMSYRLSERVNLIVAASHNVTKAVNGFGMRSDQQSLAFDRRMSGRNTFGMTYIHGEVVFAGIGTQPTRTHALLGTWTRDLGARDRMILRAGPRLTDTTYSADVAASLTHSFKHSAIGIAIARNPSTVIGYAGVVETTSVQAMLSYNLGRNLTVFATPAAYRTSREQLKGVVYRVSSGLRYTLTSFLQAEVTYNSDSQTGAIDPLQPNARLTHSTLAIGFTTRPKIRDAAR